MKAWIFSIILLIVIACGPVTQATGPTGEELPPYLEQVMPADGSTISNEDLFVGTDAFGGICADFNFQKKFGPAPQELVQFYLDGMNITSKLTLRASMDYLTSWGAFCYTPREPIAEGWHTAQVVYQDVEGNRYSYRWRFRVQ